MKKKRKEVRIVETSCYKFLIEAGAVIVRAVPKVTRAFSATTSHFPAYWITWAHLFIDCGQSYWDVHRQAYDKKRNCN